ATASATRAPSEPPPRAVRPRGYVLGRMEELGTITATQAHIAEATGLGVREAPRPIDTEEPYFVEAVKRQILGDRLFGRSYSERTRSLWKGGLRIETTLEPRLQKAAQDAAAGSLGRRKDPEVALVAIRPKTGAVVAMIGGRDWSTSQVNLALGKDGGGSGRQPGSAFKPIALAAALEAGRSLDDRYAAAPGLFELSDGSTWTVGNSEGTAGGFLPLREALIRSVNGVFARLALDIGGSAIAAQADLMGIATDLSGHPSIALGAEEVSVLDMAAAYATLAAGGDAVEPTTIKKVTLPSGEVVVPEQERQEHALSPGNAFLITKALEEVIVRGTGTAASIGRPAAAKTGTSNDYADAWFVGYTPQLVTAVWVGYPEGRIPMTNVHGIRVFGGTFPALIWRNFMLTAHQGVPVKRFKLPDSAYVKVEIDPASGLLAAPWCPGKKQRLLRELVPLEYCPPPPPPEPAPLPTPSFSPSPATKDGRGDGSTKDEPSPSPTGPKDPPGSPKPSRSP
ncbi:MAG: transglycosylase domain-containing protein, partial [Actinomycetota bacterium]